jgi:hypothetical protein
VIKQWIVGISLLAAYLNVAVAGAPKPVAYKWRLEYGEFRTDDTAGRVDKAVALGADAHTFTLGKVGWTCSAHKGTGLDKKGFPYEHEAYVLGCSRDGQNVVAVEHFCYSLDQSKYPGVFNATASPVTLFSRNSKYQARILITCEQVGREIARDK